MIAAELATMRHGGDRRSAEFKAPIGALKDDQAAALLNVSERSVERAKEVKRAAIPEVVAAVKAGEMPVSFAAKVARKPEEEQAKVVKLPMARRRLRSGGVVRVRGVQAMTRVPYGPDYREAFDVRPVTADDDGVAIRPGYVAVEDDDTGERWVLTPERAAALARALDEGVRRLKGTAR